jgi:protein BUR2
MPAIDNGASGEQPDQWLFDEDALNQTPSVLCGLTPAQERTNRAKGINFILQTGIMLKLPQITLATASVYLHRFYCRQTMCEDKRAPGRPFYHYYSIAATSVWLASKVEENCRKMKELVVACVRVAQKDANKVVDEQDKEFWRWRDTILQLEDLLLETLCFDLSLEPPYKSLFEFLKLLDAADNKPLRNAAWGWVNDSQLTPMCLLWPSRTIAASALYAAARHCGVSFLDDLRGRPWWEVVGENVREIKKACNFMAAVYENAPLRGGSDETASMYQRTPEDGDDVLAKTRQTRPESELVQMEDIPMSSPRKREAGEESTEGDEREPKKAKVEEASNGTAAASNGMDTGDDEAAGSEEGEVED